MLHDQVGVKVQYANGYCFEPYPPTSGGVVGGVWTPTYTDIVHKLSNGTVHSSSGTLSTQGASWIGSSESVAHFQIFCVYDPPDDADSTGNVRFTFSLPFECANIVGSNEITAHVWRADDPQTPNVDEEASYGGQDGGGLIDPLDADTPPYTRAFTNVGIYSWAQSLLFPKGILIKGMLLNT